MGKTLIAVVVSILGFTVFAQVAPVPVRIVPREERLLGTWGPETPMDRAMAEREKQRLALQRIQGKFNQPTAECVRDPSWKATTNQIARLMAGMDKNLKEKQLLAKVAASQEGQTAEKARLATLNGYLLNQELALSKLRTGLTAIEAKYELKAAKSH